MYLCHASSLMWKTRDQETDWLPITISCKAQLHFSPLGTLMLFYPCHSFWRVTTMNSFVFIPKSFPIFALLTAVRMAARTVSFFSFWFKLLLVHFTPCFQRRYMAYMLQILANFSDFTPLKYFLNCPFFNTVLLWNLPCVCICMPCICIYCTLSNSSKACLSSALCSRSSSSFLVILESVTKLKKTFFSS